MYDLHRKSTKGFTLLEVLVVLVLIGLISTILMQGFTFVINVQERVKRQLLLSQNLELREGWFRLVVRSINGGRNDTDGFRFAGNTTSFQGVALQPLIGKRQIPQQISWRIEERERGHALVYYQQNHKPVVVLQGLLEGASFQFMDYQGNFHAAWPIANDQFFPQEVPSGIVQKPPLPAGILLNSETQFGQKVLWYVAISNNTLPVVDFSQWE